MYSEKKGSYAVGPKNGGQNHLIIDEVGPVITRGRVHFLSVLTRTGEIERSYGPWVEIFGSVEKRGLE